MAGNEFQLRPKSRQKNRNQRNGQEDLGLKVNFIALVIADHVKVFVTLLRLLATFQMARKY